jgi:hypothetical protein
MCGRLSSGCQFECDLCVNGLRSVTGRILVTWRRFSIQNSGLPYSSQNSGSEPFKTWDIIRRWRRWLNSYKETKSRRNMRERNVKKRRIIMIRNVCFAGKHTCSIKFWSLNVFFECTKYKIVIWADGLCVRLVIGGWGQRQPQSQKLMHSVQNTNNNWPLTVSGRT